MPLDPNPTDPTESENSPRLPYKWEIEQEFRKACSFEATKSMGQWIEMHEDLLEEPGEKSRWLEYCTLSNKPTSLDFLLKLGFLEKKKEESELLIKSCIFGSSKTLICLLKHGFNPHLVTSEGLNALKEACRGGHFNAVKTLLKVGVVPNTITHEELLASSINQKNETLRLIMEKYPIKILEDISEDITKPAQDSKIPFVVQAGSFSRKKADELTKTIATSILKDISKKTLSKHISQNDKSLEI